MKKAAALLLVGALLTLFSAINSDASAEDFSIVGNGAGSQNNINTQDSTTNQTQQSNQADITNEGGASANSGGNTGSATTGDATSLFQVNNQFNNNQAQSGCCPTETPKPTAKPTDPVATATQGAKTPTAPPVPSSGNGGPPAGGGGTSVSQPGSQAEILGLSDTASIDWRQVSQILGIICVAAGSILLKGKSSGTA